MIVNRLSNRLALLQLEKMRSEKRLAAAKAKAARIIEHRQDREKVLADREKRDRDSPKRAFSHDSGETVKACVAQWHQLNRQMYLEGRQARDALEAEQRRARESDLLRNRERSSSIRVSSQGSTKAVRRVEAVKRERFQSARRDRVEWERALLAKSIDDARKKAELEQRLIAELAKQREEEIKFACELEEIIKNGAKLGRTPSIH